MKITVTLVNHKLKDIYDVVFKYFELGYTVCVVEIDKQIIELVKSDSFSDMITKYENAIKNNLL